VECKRILIENVNERLSGPREIRKRVSRDDSYLDGVLEEGRRSASAVALETLERVRRAVGLW